MPPSDHNDRRISKVIPDKTVPKDSQSHTIELLSALNRITDPHASAEDRLLERVIRTLAKYLRLAAPMSSESQDLEVLMAVSIVLNQRAERK
jgi:hypothetical protein